MNTFLEIELNQMHYEELLAEAEHVRMVGRAMNAERSDRMSIVQRLALGLKGVIQRKEIRRVLSPAANS